MTNIYGVACSGGGSKGAWLAGWFKRLFDSKPDINIGAIAGTSTGSLNGAKVGAYLVTRDTTHIVDLVDLYQNVNTADILTPKHKFTHSIGGNVASLIMSALTGGDAIYDTSPLKQLIDEYMPRDLWMKLIRAGRRKRNPIEVGFCCVSMQTGRAKTFTNITHPDPNILAKALLASASEPIFTPLVEIEGEQWTDGGINDYIPITSLFESSQAHRLNRIMALSLASSEGSPEVGQLEGIDDVFGRTIELLIDGVYGNNLRKAELYNALLLLKGKIPEKTWRELADDTIEQKLSGKRYVKIIKACPSKPIMMDGLTFDPRAMKNLCRDGYRDARTFLNKNEL